MNYFSSFSNILYDMIGTNIDYKVVRDIFIKCAIKNNIKYNNDAYVIYTLGEDEKIEDLSYRLYGDSTYHWTILLMNDIVNPYYDLPLSTIEFNNYLMKKYDGAYLFLTNINGKFKVGDNVTIDGSTGKILSYDNTTKRIFVDNLGNKADGLSITSSSGASATATRFDYRAQDSLHHFEDDFGHILSPVVNPNIASSIDCIGEYISGAPSVGYNIITNGDYEDGLNESKRNIKLINDKYLGVVIKDFKEMVGAI